MKKTLNRIETQGGSLSDFDLDILTTKFTLTLTEKVIKKLPQNMIRPDIDTVDSNSELNIQIQEILNPGLNVGAVEIVQSGKSLIATDAYVVSNGKVIEPSKRDKQTGEFEGDIVCNLNPSSQVGRIANGIQRDISLVLYEINKSTNNKSNDFISAIQDSMRNIK